MKTKNIEVYVPEADNGGIILSANENPKNMPKEYMNEIEQMLKTFEFNRYPDTNCTELRKAYAAYCGEDYERIICGNGSDEVIRLIITAFGGGGAGIVVHDPTFSMYDITNTCLGGKTIKIVSEDGVNADIEKIINTAKEERAKIVFLCNPNNPTGSVFSREELVKAIDALKEQVVVVDEAYIEFGGESVIDLTGKKSNLIVLRTLSKVFGLSALRIGFGIGSKEIITELNRVKAPYNLNQLSQNIGVIALNHIDLIKTAARELTEQRDKVFNELCGIEWLQAYAGNGNFIYIKADAQRVKKALNGKVAIRYFTDEYVRITIGEKEENETLLKLLQEG